MVDSFQELKNSRRENFEKLQEDLKKMQSGQKFVRESEDERFWQPTARAKDGSGEAVIRFLPAPKGEEKAIVRVFSHGFEGPNGWYIDRSLSTFQDSQGNPKPDPVAAMNRKLWNMGKDSPGQIFVSGDPLNKRPGSKRKLSYYTNVYVVKDSEKPSNEGTVRLYKFGARIHDKLVEASEPKFSDYEKFNPFDLFGGTNFKLRFANNEKGFRQYTPSEWDLIEENGIKKPRGALFDDDKMEKIWLQCHSLYDFVNPEKFKTYNELEERLRRIMGNKFADVLWDGAPTTEEKEVSSSPAVDSKAAPWEDAPAPDAVQATPTKDEMDWFRELRNEVA